CRDSLQIRWYIAIPMVKSVATLVGRRLMRGTALGLVQLPGSTGTNGFLPIQPGLAIWADWVQRAIAVLGLATWMLVGSASADTAEEEGSEAESTVEEAAEESEPDAEKPLDESFSDLFGEDEEFELEEIFGVDDPELDGYEDEEEEVDYPETENCINIKRMRSHEVLSDRFVVIHMAGGKRYLIQFEHSCAGLRPRSLIAFNRRGLRLCKNDELRAELSSSGGNTLWSGPCRIPGFEPVTEHQIDLLKSGLMTERVD
ncbi:MAG: hypothetical protein J4F97_05345, partial [Pseudomonadales bacterium]|nr:hypothetical protein [Pseudomonadales bacterium]